MEIDELLRNFAPKTLEVTDQEIDIDVKQYMDQADEMIKTKKEQKWLDQFAYKNLLYGESLDPSTIDRK